MHASIVIPVYNALELAKACVARIFEHGCSLTYEVIVVDNGSADDVEDWLIEQEGVHANLRHLRSAEPLGFAGAVNVGAAACAGEALIILNSDTLVSPGWIEGLCGPLHEDALLGALTPVTNHAGEPAQMNFGTVDLPPGKAFAAFLKQAREPRVFYLPQRITFFCVAFRRCVWLQFGGLDEAYRVGNFEDDDLCLRLRVAGFRLGVAQHVFVYHHNNSTFEANGISHGEWMQNNAQTFAERARRFAVALDLEGTSVASRPPKRSVPEISVVVLASTTGSRELTLRSLENQTIGDFEVVVPESLQEPSGLWIAYITEGDILYPFHLETLLDALERTGSEAIFADVWVSDGNVSGVALSHPDAAPSLREAPLFLAGWMHHAALERSRLYRESIPMHWPRLTWQMRELPVLASATVSRELTASERLIEAARQRYRRLVPLEMRHRIDRRVRSLLKARIDTATRSMTQEIAHKLESFIELGADRGRFAVETARPAIFLFNAVTWNSATQRQHHFARGLANRGHTVFWIDTTMNPARNWWTGKAFSQVYRGVHLVRLPSAFRDIYGVGWDDASVDAMAAALVLSAAAYATGEAVLLVNYPRWQPLATRLHQRCGWKIASDCLDDQRALASLYQVEYGRYEELLFESSEVIFTSSLVLQRRILPRPSLLLHNANDFELFSSAKPLSRQGEMAKPVIGFFGVLSDWLDMELIHAAAVRYPQWTFVYIGPQTFSRPSSELQWRRATDVSNIVVLPQMKPPLLATHLASFDVCTIPFLDLPVTQVMNPVKLYEYFAAGKPTVSRDLPEVRYLAEGDARDLIALYKTPEEFFERLEQALASDTLEQTIRRQEFAKRNDWNHRCDELSDALLKLVTR